MTRINCGIDPSELTREHLIAEHREIIRIPGVISKGKANFDNIPESFRLGAGHVKFFYNKLQYLKERYASLYSEGIKRGYTLTSFHHVFDGLPKELMNGYTPSEYDRNIVKQRIETRLKESAAKAKAKREKTLR